jgi:Polyketide cyclase / dehydrase and lipid transport
VGTRNTMRTWTATSTAPPEAAWPLLSRPAAWPTWAPHLGGAWRLGSPEVRLGAVGAARLAGVIPVPARIVGKQPGRSWTWRVGLGLVEMVHRVEPRADGGSTVAIDVLAPPPVEKALAAAYGPIIQATLERLARKAAA